MQANKNLCPEDKHAPPPFGGPFRRDKLTVTKHGTKPAEFALPERPAVPARGPERVFARVPPGLDWAVTPEAHDAPYVEEAEYDDGEAAGDADLDSPRTEYAYDEDADFDSTPRYTRRSRDEEQEEAAGGRRLLV